MNNLWMYFCEKFSYLIQWQTTFLQLLTLNKSSIATSAAKYCTIFLTEITFFCFSRQLNHLFKYVGIRRHYDYLLKITSGCFFQKLKTSGASYSLYRLFVVKLLTIFLTHAWRTISAKLLINQLSRSSCICVTLHSMQITCTFCASATEKVSVPLHYINACITIGAVLTLDANLLICRCVLIKCLHSSKLRITCSYLQCWIIFDKFLMDQLYNLLHYLLFSKNVVWMATNTCIYKMGF